MRNVHIYLLLRNIDWHKNYVVFIQSICSKHRTGCNWHRLYCPEFITNPSDAIWSTASRYVGAAMMTATPLPAEQSPATGTLPTAPRLSISCTSNPRTAALHR